MKKFDYTTTTEPVDGLEVQVIKIEGFLDSSTFDQLQDHLQALIDDNKFNLLVEFGNLNYISSAGLGVLMGMLKEVRHNGGDLKLANMSPKVRNLFDMLGFSRLIRIYDTCDRAKQAFVTDLAQKASSEEPPAPEDGY